MYIANLDRLFDILLTFVTMQITICYFNFHKVFKNVCWLGLREEAEQLLIRYVDEMESQGVYVSDYIPPAEFARHCYDVVD
jgi:hypothetical protein